MAKACLSWSMVPLTWSRVKDKKNKEKRQADHTERISQVSTWYLDQRWPSKHTLCTFMRVMDFWLMGSMVHVLQHLYSSILCACFLGSGTKRISFAAILSSKHNSGLHVFIYFSPLHFQGGLLFVLRSSVLMPVPIKPLCKYRYRKCLNLGWCRRQQENPFHERYKSQIHLSKSLWFLGHEQKRL